MKKALSLLKIITSSESQDDLRINSLMANIFHEKTTIESIDLFEKFKARYESELSRRNLDAMIESSDIDAYFNQTKKIEVNQPIIL